MKHFLLLLVLSTILTLLLTALTNWLISAPFAEKSGPDVSSRLLLVGWPCTEAVPSAKENCSSARVA